jgi:hypothetical protein
MSSPPNCCRDGDSAVTAARLAIVARWCGGVLAAELLRRWGEPRYDNERSPYFAAISRAQATQPHLAALRPLLPSVLSAAQSPTKCALPAAYRQIKTQKDGAEALTLERLCPHGTGVFSRQAGEFPVSSFFLCESPTPNRQSGILANLAAPFLHQGKLRAALQKPRNPKTQLEAGESRREKRNWKLEKRKSPNCRPTSEIVNWEGENRKTKFENRKSKIVNRKSKIAFPPGT